MDYCVTAVQHRLAWRHHVMCEGELLAIEHQCLSVIEKFVLIAAALILHFCDTVLKTLERMNGGMDLILGI